MKILFMMLMALMFMGCGGDTSVESVVPDGSVVTLDENQTIGYVPNSDMQIISQGDNSYYIDCNGAEDCSVHIGDSNDDTYSDINNTENSNNNTDSNDNNSVNEEPVVVVETPVVVTDTTNNYTTVEP